MGLQCALARTRLKFTHLLLEYTWEIGQPYFGEYPFPYPRYCMFKSSWEFNSPLKIKNFFLPKFDEFCPRAFCAKLHKQRATFATLSLDSRLHQLLNVNYVQTYLSMSENWLVSRCYYLQLVLESLRGTPELQKLTQRRMYTLEPKT